MNTTPYRTAVPFTVRGHPMPTQPRAFSKLTSYCLKIIQCYLRTYTKVHQIQSFLRRFLIKSCIHFPSVLPTHTHTYALTHIHTYIHTYTHIRARAHKHTHIQTHTNTLTYKHTHKHKHTHTHSHTHTTPRDVINQSIFAFPPVPSRRPQIISSVTGSMFSQAQHLHYNV
jgi:hypothetical protein